MFELLITLIRLIFGTFLSSLNFFCINLKQQVEKTQTSAEAGFLKLKFAQLRFFFTVYF